MTKLTIKTDEGLYSRLKQRAENERRYGPAAFVALIEGLLATALDIVDAPEPPPARQLDETTQRCVTALGDVADRLTASHPASTCGLIAFSDANEAIDGSAQRTVSVTVVTVPRVL